MPDIFIQAPPGVDAVVRSHGADIYLYRGTKIFHWKNMPAHRRDRWRIGEWNGQAFESLEACVKHVDENGK